MRLAKRRMTSNEALLAALPFGASRAGAARYMKPIIRLPSLSQKRRPLRLCRATLLMTPNSRLSGIPTPARDGAGHSTIEIQLVDASPALTGVNT